MNIDVLLQWWKKPTIAIHIAPPKLWDKIINQQILFKVRASSEKDQNNKIARKYFQVLNHPINTLKKVML